MLRTNFRPRAGMMRDGKGVPFAVLVKENLQVALFGGLFLAGVALGALVVSWLDGDTVTGLLKILGGFVESRRHQELSLTFSSAFSSSFVMLLILFFCGFCAISLPVILIVPFFKGLGFGLSAGTIFACYGIGAVNYVGFLMLPNVILSAVAIILACRESMKLSLQFYSAIGPASQRNGPSIRPGPYCARYLLFLLMIAVGAAAESYLYFAFSGLFTL